MKAVVYTRYGSPEVLSLMDVDMPVPRPDEVLIRVVAAAVNSWDWDLLTGTPFLARLGGGLFAPPYKILGADVAGRVEAVGAAVTRFKPGDAVLGDLSGGNWGSFAEYVCARESALTLKPESLSFEEAAAIPQAGLLALQGLRCNGSIAPGDKVLINGAGGGVGSFAVQLAKLWGAEVTGVDRAEKLELMREVGADHVLDYRAGDFAAAGKRYDLILDVTARRPLSAYRRALTATGRLVVVGGATRTILQTAIAGLFGRPGGQRLALLLHKPNIPDLDEMKALAAAGTIRCMIGARYPLSDTAEALREVGEGRAKGKVVVKVAPGAPSADIGI